MKRVLMSDELFAALGAGQVDWGDPDADGFYTPTVRTGALQEAHKALGSFIWLGNNLHNSDTETFRDLYRACLSEAVTAYNATLDDGEAPA